MTTLRSSVPQELLQAQVGAYGAAELADRTDHDALLRHIGAGALALADVVTRDAPKRTWEQLTEFGPDGETQFGWVEPGARVVTTREEFTNWLKSNGNEHGRPVQARLELIQAYNQKFKEPVRALRDEVRGLDDPKSHPDHLGEGGTSRAVALHMPDGDYAVRLPLHFEIKESNPLIANESVDTMDRVKGLRHVEQLVAISIEDGVTVSKVLPGKDGLHLFGEDLSRVKPHQLSQLLDTLEELQKRGIHIDSKQSNFLYDPEEGFSIVDISVEKNSPGAKAYQPLNQKIEAALSLLTTSGLVNDMAVQADSAEEFASLARDKQARLPILQDFYKVCAARYPDKTELLTKLKPDVISEEARIAKWSDPTWFEGEKERQRAGLAEGRVQGDDNDWL